MDKRELKERLMATFLGELEEHARALETQALALEKDAGEGRAEIVKTLFRAAHSLKGAARSVGVPPIEAICHRLEERLGGVRDGVVPVSAELVQGLLSAADALADAGRRLRAKEELAGSPLAVLLARPEALETPARRSASPPAPPPRPPKPVAAGPTAASPDGAVRVAAARLDALVAQGGELLLARRRAVRRQEDVAALLGTMNRCLAEWRHLERPRDLPRRAALATERTTLALKKLSRDLERLARDMASDHHALDRAAAPLEEEIRRVRMRPFAEACEGLARAVRDLGRAAGKAVELVVEGDDVELDGAVLAGLRDPLLHLVRNAVDHGIEPPAERRARGKPTQGRVTIAAALAREGVEVTVADDGRGIDLAAVRDQARRRGLAVPNDDRELLRLVFSPGLSTSPLVTELSGRGMGLDVVRDAVEGLHGRVDLAFEPGAGTRFVLAVPLTLSTTRVLFVAVAGQTYALPSAHVRGLVRASADDLGSVEGREVLLGGASPIPVVALAEVLGLPSREPARVGGKVLLVLLGAGERSIACAVDELASEQDVVVKSLGRRLRRVPRVAGATVLPTGRLALVLAAAEVVDAALGLEPARPLVPALAESPATSRKRLLVVDDSITTRTLERSILEAAGYDVITAADGAEAWHALHEITVDLVVADVEMPRMDGFALTEAIRGSKRLRDLPVVLVTALETEPDKARGLEAGADAYLPKSTFDQSRLLQVVAQLV